MIPSSLRLTGDGGCEVSMPGGKIKGSYSRAPLLNSCVGCKSNLRFDVSEVGDSRIKQVCLLSVNRHELSNNSLKQLDNLVCLPN